MIFLRWDTMQETFVRLDASLGGAAAFAIENGRIRSAGIARYAGKPAAALMTELQGLARR